MKRWRIDQRSYHVVGVGTRRRSISSREKVEGTELEVGAPIMKSRESTHALGLRAGQRALLSTPALDGSGETLLVVLEAAVVENPGEKAVPYTKDGGGR